MEGIVTPCVIIYIVDLKHSSLAGRIWQEMPCSHTMELVIIICSSSYVGICMHACTCKATMHANVDTHS